MKKFMAIYHTPAQVMAQNANMPAEDQEKGMQAWFAWRDRCGDHLLDFGAPLLPGQAIHQNGNWTASSTSTNGYSILQGENLTQVQALFTNHPHLSWGEGCTVDLHELVEM